MLKLLKSFQQFFHENAPAWLESFAYKEAGPHLLLMAFLQRIVNSGGQIIREYALGRKRVDLLVKWPDQRIVLELKLLRYLSKDRQKNLQKVLAEGLRQTSEYMYSSKATEGHLLIFNHYLNAPLQEKVYHYLKQYRGVKIHVWGV